MKRFFYMLFILLIVFPLSCQNTNNEVVNGESSINKNQVLRLINAYRSSGCDCGTEGVFAPATPVKWNETLERAAKAHCLDMFTNNFFSHTGSDGSNCGSRLDKFQYQWQSYGENIGKGYKNEKDVVEGWIKSPGHCRNIMNPNVKEIGLAKKGEYWTLVLAAHK